MAADSDLRAVSRLLESPLAPTARKLIEKAADLGWHHNGTSMVTRWSPPGDIGEPFFMTWILELDTKWKWRFAGGVAANLQRLTIADAMLYLEHPEVIYPQPLEET